jgi:hypothetical protein
MLMQLSRSARSCGRGAQVRATAKAWDGARRTGAAVLAGDRVWASNQTGVLTW